MIWKPRANDKGGIFIYLIMKKSNIKLFITNKDYFEETFDHGDNRNGFFYTSRKIHQLAYNELADGLANYCIPLMLIPPYKDDLSNASFVFKAKKDDIYFYEFIGTAS